MQRKRILLAAVFMFVALCCVILWPLATTAQLSSNSFSPATWYPSGNATTGSVATGDLNHDGYPDLGVRRVATRASSATSIMAVVRPIGIRMVLLGQTGPASGSL